MPKSCKIYWNFPLHNSYKPYQYVQMISGKPRPSDFFAKVLGHPGTHLVLRFAEPRKMIDKLWVVTCFKKL